MAIACRSFCVQSISTMADVAICVTMMALFHGDVRLIIALITFIILLRTIYISLNRKNTNHTRPCLLD